MKPSLFFAVAMAVLLPSCSCAIRREEWKITGRCCPSDEAALRSAALACGFRWDGDVMNKRDYYLRIHDAGRKVRLQSSWCPYPQNLIFMRSNFAAWNERGDQMWDAFLEETRQRGLRLEKQ